MFSFTEIQALCATFSVFFQEFLTLKSCTCSTGATGMGPPAAGLAATWAAGLATLLVKGLARDLAALAGWWLRELGWVVGVLAHGGETSVLYGHSHASPQCQSAQRVMDRTLYHVEHFRFSQFQPWMSIILTCTHLVLLSISNFSGAVLCLSRFWARQSVVLTTGGPQRGGRGG